MTPNPKTISTSTTTTTNDQLTTHPALKITNPRQSSKARTDQFQPPHYKITTTTYLCITIRWVERSNVRIRHFGQPAGGGPSC